MVRFVFRADAFEDEDGVFHAGGLDFDRLEAAFEGGILLDVFAVFVERGRADALQFAAGKGGLDDVRGVHRPFGRAGADDGVKLVDEKDDVLALADFIHHRLDALLELPTVFGPGHHKSEVEGDDAFVAEEFGHVAGHDFLGQAFGDGSFAHAGFTDENGVVFRAAAEDLDDALDLAAASDDGIHVALFGHIVEVAAEGAEGGCLDLLAAAAPAAAHVGGFHVIVFRGEIRIKLAEDFVARALDVDVEVFEDFGGHAVAFAEEAEQDVLGTDVGVAECLGLLAGEGKDLLHAGGVRNVADHLGLGTGADLFFDLHAHRLEVEAHFGQNVDRHALA